MGQPQYLIDTNAAIDYLAGKLPTAGMIFTDGVVDARPQLSIIIRIELLGYPLAGAHVQIMADDSNILQLTEDVANECIAIRVAKKIKLPDAIIATTVIVNSLTL